MNILQIPENLKTTLHYIWNDSIISRVTTAPLLKTNLKQEFDFILKCFDFNIEDFTDVTERYGDTNDLQDSTKCICSHPIQQLCFIQHTQSGLVFLVGRDCVEKINPILGFEMKKSIENLKLRKENAIKCNNCANYIKTTTPPYIDNTGQSIKFCHLCIDLIKKIKKEPSMYQEYIKKINIISIAKELESDLKTFFKNERKNGLKIDQKNAKNFNKLKMTICDDVEFKGRGMTWNDVFINFPQECMEIKNKIIDLATLSSNSKYGKILNFILQAEQSMIIDNILIFNFKYKKCLNCSNNLDKNNVKLFCRTSCKSKYQLKHTCHFCNQIYYKNYNGCCSNECYIFHNEELSLLNRFSNKDTIIQCTDKTYILVPFKKNAHAKAYHAKWVKGDCFYFMNSLAETDKTILTNTYKKIIIMKNYSECNSQEYFTILEHELKKEDSNILLLKFLLFKLNNDYENRILNLFEKYGIISSLEPFLMQKYKINFV